MFWREICLLKPDSIYKDQLINASREVVTVHCKNNMKPINTVYWQNVLFVLQEVIYINFRKGTGNI